MNLEEPRIIDADIQDDVDDAAVRNALGLPEKPVEVLSENVGNLRAAYSTTTSTSLEDVDMDEYEDDGA